MYGPKWPFLLVILLICGPSVVVMKIWDMLYFGRAPRTKETLPDFHEWCQVTRHPRLFRKLTTDPRVLGRHNLFMSFHHLYC